MRRATFVAAGWAIAATIVWLSLTPAAPPQIDLDQGDKLGHLVAYASLMLWFCLLYTHRASRIAYALLWIGMGIGLEFAQQQLDYRTYDIYDMYANSLGVLIGWALSFAIPMRVAEKLR